jgi:hypothetical protein
MKLQLGRSAHPQFWSLPVTAEGLGLKESQLGIFVSLEDLFVHCNSWLRLHRSKGQVVQQ